MRFPQVAFALRRSISKTYFKDDLLNDLWSGLSLSFIAIPLGLALAIACGVPPVLGLVTVVVAGASAAVLGGSRFQISGPTAAFVVLLIPVVQEFGLAGLWIATSMAGILIVLLSISGLGSLIAWIPYPVIMGFTAGIGVVIIALQAKDFVGWSGDLSFSSYPWAEAGWSPAALGVGVLSLCVIFGLSRYKKKLPPAVVAVVAASIAAHLLQLWKPEWRVETLGSRFSDLRFSFSEMPGLSSVSWSFSLIGDLMPSALAIAVLASIESLLSASVADAVTQDRHDPNAELFGIGVANILAPLFGGFAATGAIARTSANIEFGARTPLSAVFHALFTLFVLLYLLKLLAFIPMAALAALLIYVSVRMIEPKNLLHFVRVAPMHDRFVFLACFGFTVIFDMVMGVTVGMFLAGLLFVRRAVDLTQVQSEVLSPQDAERESSPETLVYKISGPFFFGAVQKAVSSLSYLAKSYEKIRFDLSGLQSMDYTALVAFENVVSRLHKTHSKIEILTSSREVEKLLKTSTSLKSKAHITRSS